MNSEITYGCPSCGEVFKVDSMYGLKVKFTPCCGDSEVNIIKKDNEK